MKTRTEKISFSNRAESYDISIRSGILADIGKLARHRAGKGTQRAFIISNAKVFGLYGDAVSESLRAGGFDVDSFQIGDGERFKSLKTAEKALKALAGSKITRTDLIVALGGGVVGDLAGFVAAVYYRGVPFFQIPTTLLSMIDSSVGGKTGVNSTFGKNLIGAFHQPVGVAIDPSVLSTLDSREVTAGLCEIVKHGAIGGRALLNDTASLLEQTRPAGFHASLADRKFTEHLTSLIAENVAFKARIVAGDEREAAGRTDTRSRKILNFGHTLAHALEKATNYRYFKHGEAVGYGILFAAELSKTLALCSQKDVNLLNDVVQSVGALPSVANIDGDEVLEAFKFDKKQLSGSLQMVLLKGIGKPVIMTEKDIPRTTVQKVLKDLLEKRA